MAGAAPLIVPALKKHTASVIWAHGLGDSGAGWYSEKQPFDNESAMAGTSQDANRGELPKKGQVRRNHLHIPQCALDSNHGEFWDENARTNFDDLTQAHDQTGILRSREYFNSLVKQEIAKGIPSSRIILGGFSQGGAISIFTGITSPDKLAGIFGLSSYMLLGGKIKDFVPAENPNKDTPIFMGHGDADPLVRYDWGLKTAANLRELGWNVNFNTYAGLAHSAEPKEMDDVEAFIRERLPPLGGGENATSTSTTTTN